MYSNEKQSKGWHSRGYLPHFSSFDHIQFVTYRLADAVPAEVALRLQEEAITPDGEAHYRKRIEEWMDSGHGECHLQKAAVAEIVQNCWSHSDCDCYLLHGWVIMPNHVHVLFECWEPHDMSSIIETWKSVTSRRINKSVGRSGQLWLEDYWDRYIRDNEHYLNCRSYIAENPVKAGLGEEWPHVYLPRIDDLKASSRLLNALG